MSMMLPRQLAMVSEYRYGIKIDDKERYDKYSIHRYLLNDYAGEKTQVSFYNIPQVEATGIFNRKLIKGLMLPLRPFMFAKKYALEISEVQSDNGNHKNPPGEHENLIVRPPPKKRRNEKQSGKNGSKKRRKKKESSQTVVGKKRKRKQGRNQKKKSKRRKVPQNVGDCKYCNVVEADSVYRCRFCTKKVHDGKINNRLMCGQVLIPPRAKVSSSVTYCAHNECLLGIFDKYKMSCRMMETEFISPLVDGSSMFYCTAG